MYEVLFDAVRYAALSRAIWLLVGLARMIPVHVRARTRSWGLAEGLALSELFGFLMLTWLLFAHPPAMPVASATSWLTAVIGATLAVAGVLVSIWAIYTTTRAGMILDGGHFVKQEHLLITKGAYGFVRNPMYLGILLLWFGIAMAFQNWILLIVAMGYVVPVFHFYILSEDRMMLSEFGEQYEAYQRRVGSLLPRIHHSRA